MQFDAVTLLFKQISYGFADFMHFYAFLYRFNANFIQNNEFFMQIQSKLYDQYCMHDLCLLYASMQIFCAISFNPDLCRFNEYICIDANILCILYTYFKADLYRLYADLCV
jgi:hypothetical protein